MFSSIKGSVSRSACLGTIRMAAVILSLAAVPTLKAQTDITSSSFPHTADSVLYDAYFMYDPSNVSDNELGLEYAAWHSGDERTGDYFPHWVQIDFGQPRTVKQLKLMVYSESDIARLRLKDFRFEGSNDGVTYTALHDGLLQYANEHVWQSFSFQNTTGYRYYRLYGLNNWGCIDDLCEQMIIEEWEMFESPVGACCFPSGNCLVGTQADCDGADGSYMGDGTSCDPNPCGLTPADEMTWGRIKAQFR